MPSARAEIGPGIIHSSVRVAGHMYVKLCVSVFVDYEITMPNVRIEMHVNHIQLR